MAHAVITGGADGIGRALALRRAAAGAAVTLVDFDAELAARTAAEIAERGAVARVIQADLARPVEVATAAAALAAGPPIDLLVHSAGISAVGRFAEVPLAQQQAVISVNLEAPMLLTAELLERQAIADDAMLVFLASLSVFTSYPGALAYAASKDGLASYARSLRAALRRQRIGVLSVFPGPTRTLHARRYSPDNRREARRMPPERLAELIDAAVRARRRTLIPGPGPRFFAIAGRLLPGLTEWAMRKTIYERLP